MAVAFVALVLAGTGSALAAVNYARNAGAVDGRSAVLANVSLNRAAGKLVATARGGAIKGKIPNKYLDAASRADLANVGRAVPFSKAVDVVDNAVSAPQDANAIPGIGTLSLTCGDQNNAANVENPTVTLRFTNLSGTNLAVARNVEGAGATVSTLVPGAVATLTINGSNAFEWSIQRGGTNLSIHGAVQEINPGTTAATCLVFGSSLIAG
jgi:hypothetical protein